MRKLLTVTAVAVSLALTSGVALASSCPKIIKEGRDAAATMKADDPKVKAAVAKLAEAQKLHDGGKRADSMAKANEARAVKDPGRPKFYCLEMFPYPSGRIHMGHVRNYAIGDVLARFKRMRGFNVLHPMGWDAFGLPAENAAIEHGVQPAIWTYENIDYMRAQFKQLGISYDWERELATCDPSYYKWEQLVFIKMLERGLAYRRRSTVNWCPSCQTVLANEQVENGRCWRCDSEVTPREIDGWFFKITAYADELLEWCDRLPGWPERVITMQRNWIGRSEGAEFDLPVAGRPDLKIRVFTTRPDTAFGMTYAVLAPEHPLVDQLVTDEAERRAVAEFRAQVARESEIERLAADRPKHGLRLRAKVVNPFNGAEIPLFIADYVLMGYGTGAIMAVPGEDQRDWDFAKQHDLPIIETVERPPGWVGEAYTGEGIKINSGFLDGLTVADAKRRAIDWLVQRGLGEAKVNYRLRDWGISRQRYWGAPLPILYCEGCGMVPAALHPLYARFNPKVWRGLGLTKGDEPFTALLSEGMVIKDGAKMSKSKGNIVDPDEQVRKYGADTARLFSLFAAPPEKDLDWNDHGVEGAFRFLSRVWRFVAGHLEELRQVGSLRGAPGAEESRTFRRTIHETVKRVTDDIEHDFHFNTAVSAIMELVNALPAFESAPPDRVPPGERTALLREAVEAMLLLLAPFCPHITEELWARLRPTESVFARRGARADPAALERAEVTLVVQIDGKVRSRLTVEAGAPEADVQRRALADDKVKTWLAARRGERGVVVPHPLLHIVPERKNGR